MSSTNTHSNCIQYKLDSKAPPPPSQTVETLFLTTEEPDDEDLPRSYEELKKEYDERNKHRGLAR